MTNSITRDEYGNEIDEKNLITPDNISFTVIVDAVLIQYTYEYSRVNGRQIKPINLKIDGKASGGGRCTFYVYLNDQTLVPTSTVEQSTKDKTFIIRKKFPTEWFDEIESAMRDPYICLKAQTVKGVPNVDFGPTSKSILLKKAP